MIAAAHVTAHDVPRVLELADAEYPRALRSLPQPPPILYVQGRLELLERPGLARGIDSIAHRTALDVGGDTVGVLGTGLDVPYPPEHRELAMAMAERGCLVTEFAPGTPPRKYHFPQRNRIIAGLARGVLVIEAPERSGALITAHYALEGGKEVFAVPGPIHKRTGSWRGPL